MTKTVASEPLEIPVRFAPQIRHVMKPTLVLQEIVLFADTAAAPAAMVTDEKSDAE